MKTYNKLQEYKLREIKPNGWLKRFLETQRDGLTGHMEVCGFPFDVSDWGEKSILIDEGSPEVPLSWWPYEATAYCDDALTKCGCLLEDDFMREKAAKVTDYVLNHQDEDGYLGPKFLKEAVKDNRWVHAVFFRALTALHSATDDPRVPAALEKHYLNNTSPHSQGREVCNIEEILWTYRQTGNEKLLKHAVEAYEDYNQHHPKDATAMQNLLSEDFIECHGVTYLEIGKLGAILYCYTGDEQYLKAAEKAYKKLDRDQMLISGVNSSSEHLQGKTPLDSHETCDITNYALGASYLLMSTGNADYADKIERACFNALPGAITSDFKGLQYFSCPNQIIADKHSNHNLFYKGSEFMSYAPNAGAAYCCPGAVNLVMPNYIARMWMKDDFGNVTAALYGASELKTCVNGTNVIIRQETDYPFSDKIKFSFELSEPTEFAFSLRLPGWCENPSVEINGSSLTLSAKPGEFMPVKRLFSNGDTITLTLPMKLKLSRWQDSGIGVERGPLVYSLKIDERWETTPHEGKSTPDFPAWNLYPESDWNYALDVTEATINDAAEITENSSVSLEPFRAENAPITIKLPARRVNGWEMIHCTETDTERYSDDALKVFKIDGDFCFTPPLPDPKTLKESLSNEKEMVTLVPYGCTRLRITIFPNGGLK